MRLRVVSGKSLRTIDLEDVSQVVVFTDDGDACSASVDTPSGLVITAHAGDSDFARHLRGLGVVNRKPIEVAQL